MASKENKHFKTTTN